MFKLKISTPHGPFYENEASLLYLCTSQGFLTILPNHMPIITNVEIAPLYFINGEGIKEECACAEGILYVTRKEVRLMVDAIEYKRDIDLERAQKTLETAKALASQDALNLKLAERRIKKALNRINVKSS